MNDPVNHPRHYQANVNGQPIECLDLIEALLTPEEFRGFLLGNVHKYTFRSKNKNGQEDLKKARFYLDKYLQKNKTFVYKTRSCEVTTTEALWNETDKK